MGQQISRTSAAGPAAADDPEHFADLKGSVLALDKRGDPGCVDKRRRAYEAHAEATRRRPEADQNVEVSVPEQTTAGGTSGRDRRPTGLDQDRDVDDDDSPVPGRGSVVNGGDYPPRAWARPGRARGLGLDADIVS